MRIGKEEHALIVKFLNTLKLYSNNDPKILGSVFREESRITRMVVHWAWGPGSSTNFCQGYSPFLVNRRDRDKVTCSECSIGFVRYGGCL